MISGPTENALYRLMRRIAWTTGDESHVRNVRSVLDEVPARMHRVQSRRLPFGLPLFVVARFERTSE